MQTVCALVHEIRNTIHCLSHGNEHAVQVLSILDRMDLSAENQYDWTASEPPHHRDLRHAINEMPESLSGLTNALWNALSQLQWRVDQGRYYPPTADVGDGYRHGNMHCELIGPHGSAFHHDDFTLGLFLLKPRVLYRDHAHRAPELYVTLMEPSSWRFNGGEWRDVPSGTIIWNAPETSHAMRVCDKPFFSIYSWTHDVHSKCRVVPRDDWREIEASLNTSKHPDRFRSIEQ